VVGGFSSSTILLCSAQCFLHRAHSRLAQRVAERRWPLKLPTAISNTSLPTAQYLPEDLTTYGYASGGHRLFPSWDQLLLHQLFHVHGPNYRLTCPNTDCKLTPSATPPTISLPSKTLSRPSRIYTVTQYRIQAVDPMIDLDCNENAVREVNYGQGDVNNNRAKPDRPGPALTPGRFRRRNTADTWQI